MIDLFLLSAASLPFAHVARAEVFFSEEQVVHLMFPTLVMAPKTVDLTPDQISKIEKISDEKVRDHQVKFYTAKTGEAVLIDRVLGKHELITYAIALNKNGEIQQIEILEYKESYGGQVRKAEWKKQFYGKKNGMPIKLETSIQNISGATLSCKHVTDGVRRILETYELIRKS